MNTNPKYIKKRKKFNWIKSIRDFQKHETQTDTVFPDTPAIGNYNKYEFTST